MAAVRTQRDSVEAKITRYLAKITRYLAKITRYLTLEGASRVTAESAVARAVTALSRPSLHSLTNKEIVFSCYSTVSIEIYEVNTHPPHLRLYDNTS